MTLLKELTSSQLIDLSWVSMEKTKDDAYKLKIKMCEKSHALQEFVDNKKLLLEQDNGYWLISKP